jgi:hypothetical protein
MCDLAYALMADARYPSKYGDDSEEHF